MDDTGRDLAGVEALRRKHDGFERDLAALGDNMKDLAEEAQRLAADQPTKAGKVQGKLAEIEEAWSGLTSKAANRKKKLEESFDLHRFANDLRNALSWIQDMKTLLGADDLARDVGTATALLQRHQACTLVEDEMGRPELVVVV